ncbi:MAG: hypothetical protein FWH02_05805 [Oscillospiraceae bacterium]|nr:hypothetical protein [Oscillospiraceae bacterium]
MAGAGFAPCRLSAADQLNILREYPGQIGGLISLGLAPEDAAAVAYNAAVLYYAIKPDKPFSCIKDVLGRYSLGEIASLCKLQQQAQNSEIEFGQAGEADS